VSVTGQSNASSETGRSCAAFQANIIGLETRCLHAMNRRRDEYGNNGQTIASARQASTAGAAGQPLNRERGSNKTPLARGARNTTSRPRTVGNEISEFLTIPTMQSVLNFMTTDNV
jgi:hypothetical protein